MMPFELDQEYVIQQPYGKWQLELASITGNIQNGQVECVAFGVSFFARPLFGTAFQSIPSAAWTQQYSKQFFALVAYEKNIKERSVFLGLVPTSVSTDYQEPEIVDKHRIRTANYEIVLDDAAQQILVGSAEAEQPAVLGNPLLQAFEKLIQVLQQATILTESGPQLFQAPTQEALTNLNGTLNNILSQTIKLI